MDFERYVCFSFVPLQAKLKENTMKGGAILC